MTDLKTTSPYKKTPVKDFYLDLWKYRDVPESDDDVEVYISAEYHYRPDLMAKKYYGDPNLFWVFFIRNKNVLFDPVNDFIAGTKIFIPAKATINKLL